MDDYPSNPTPGSTSPPKVQQDNNQGQGSGYKNTPTDSAFQPKVKLEKRAV